jgi:hypothetical protein
MGRRELTVRTLIASFFITIFAALAWASVWYYILMIITFLVCAANTSCFAPTMGLPGTIIPVLYLPFLTRAMVFRGTRDKDVARISFYIAVVGAIMFSFWFGWWSEQGFGL